MPDALSKTIPIWCAVWNRLLFPHSTKDHALHTPSELVGQSEHAQIYERLANFVENVKVCTPTVPLYHELIRYW